MGNTHKRWFHGQSSGFTIVELLISTAVFSVVLLLCATATVQVGRMFYKGATINRTQDTARVVTDDVVQALQFGSKTLPGLFKRTSGGPVGIQSLCLGQVRYTFDTGVSLGTSATQSRHVLWKDHVGSKAVCTPLNIRMASPPGSSADGIELLGQNMRIPALDAVDAGSSLWRVNVTVSYGDDPALFTGVPPFTNCVSQKSGGQFCASSSVSNIFVTKRL